MFSYHWNTHLEQQTFLEFYTRRRVVMTCCCTLHAGVRGCVFIHSWTRRLRSCPKYRRAWSNCAVSWTRREPSGWRTSRRSRPTSTTRCETVMRSVAGRLSSTPRYGNQAPACHVTRVRLSLTHKNASCWRVSTDTGIRHGPRAGVTV